MNSKFEEAIFKEIVGCCISDESAKRAAQKVRSLVLSKLIGTFCDPKTKATESDSRGARLLAILESV